jgi:hypothetical protein
MSLTTGPFGVFPDWSPAIRYTLGGTAGLWKVRAGPPAGWLHSSLPGDTARWQHSDHGGHKGLVVWAWARASRSAGRPHARGPERRCPR